MLAVHPHGDRRLQPLLHVVGGQLAVVQELHRRQEGVGAALHPSETRLRLLPSRRVHLHIYGGSTTAYPSAAMTSSMAMVSWTARPSWQTTCPQVVFASWPPMTTVDPQECVVCLECVFKPYY